MFQLFLLAISLLVVAGKTPHVEYLVGLLKDVAQVAVLSRGYKRKSKGYVLANIDTPVEMIGDEPFQMKHKFPNIYVAVDKKRCDGIDHLIKRQTNSRYRCSVA